MTPDELHQMVTRRVREKGCTLDEALNGIALELAADPERLRRCWSVFGPWWLQAAYQQVIAARAGIPEAPLPPLAGGPAGPAVVAERSFRGPSWREKVDPLEIRMPVGNTGVRKPLGDFTRDDCFAVRDTYIGRAREAERVAEAWHRVAQRMGEGETLRQVADREVLVQLGVAKAEAHLVPAEA